jgi:hypothetical protein
MAAERKKGKSKTPALDSFGRDLTEIARQGKLDPVIGREREIERVVQILCRRQKNNPVLLGEAGVGKTAIVEGLAQQIVDGTCLSCCADRRIVVLDLAMMVAGTKYRGQFEERIKAVMNEVRRAKQRHPVHRRAAHAGRGRRRRGRDRCVQRAQAGAEPRRDSVHRGDDARRVPQVHREGHRAGAPLPAGHGRAADARTRRSSSSRGCAIATRRTTACRSPTRRSSGGRAFRRGTSAGFSRTRRST